MAEQHPPASGPVNADVSYEHSDAKRWPVVAIVVGIAVLGLIAHSLSLWLFDAFKDSKANANNGPPSLAAKSRPKSAEAFVEKIKEPRLQKDEAKDLQEFRASTEGRLDNYGWVDAKKGVVHIPIGEAMRLMADPEFAKSRGIRVERARGKEGGQ